MIWNTINRRSITTILAFTAVSLLLSGSCLLSPASSVRASDPGGTGDWPMWGGTADRNMVSNMKGLPTSWDVAKKLNVKWVAALGSQAYGNPVVAGGQVYVGTNNEGLRDPKVTGDKGILMAFRESDGEFLWQAVSDKLASGRVNDWPYQGVCSSPLVEGNRLYYVTNRAELVALDTQGFRDGKNDGPFTDEKLKGEHDADIIWKFDMMEEVGTHVYIANGQDPEHGEGVGHMYCIDATKRGDITKTGMVWHYDKIRRSISTPAIKDGLVYEADFSGFLHCLDAKTGQVYWVHDMFAAIWGSPVLIDGKIYLGDEDGDVTILQAGKTKKVLAEMNMGSSVYSTPVPANGVLFISNRNQLYALADMSSAKSSK